MKDRRKDRRWYVPDDNEWAIQDAADVAGGPLGYADDHNGSACIVYTHNADIEALEAENAKLRAAIEAMCGGPVTLERLEHVRADAMSYYGSEWCVEVVLKLTDALEALLPEEGDDG